MSIVAKDSQADRGRGREANAAPGAPRPASERSIIAAERRAMLKLCRAMSDEPDRLPQALVSTARTLCRAGSAALSLIADDNPDTLRIVAAEGRLAHLAGTTLPRRDCPCDLALARHEPQWVPEPAREFAALRHFKPPATLVLTVPILVGNRALGTLWVSAHGRSPRFDADDARLLRSLATFAAPHAPALAGAAPSEHLPVSEGETASDAHRLRQSTDALRVMAVQLTEAEQHERERVAQLVHDHLQQWLVAARMKIELASRTKGDTDRARLLQDAQHLLGRTLDASRSLCQQLSPPVLRDHGLAAALAWLAARMNAEHALATMVKTDAEPIDAPYALSEFLFQAARELLLNVVKHAGVLKAEVHLDTSDPAALHLTVRDAGRGCPDRDALLHNSNGFGLAMIRHRLHALGGSLDCNTAPNQGCTVTLTLPLR